MINEAGTGPLCSDVESEAPNRVHTFAAKYNLAHTFATKYNLAMGFAVLTHGKSLSGAI